MLSPKLSKFREGMHNLSPFLLRYSISFVEFRETLLTYMRDWSFFINSSFLILFFVFYFCISEETTELLCTVDLLSRASDSSRNSPELTDLQL